MLTLSAGLCASASAMAAAVQEDGAVVLNAQAANKPVVVDPATPLTFGAAPVSRTVKAGEWFDFYVDTGATADHHSIIFEVEAQTPNPAGVAVYVFDSSSHSADSLGLTTSGPTKTVFHPKWSTPGYEPPEGRKTNNAAAIDVDNLSRIGNTTHRKYFTYIGECYLTAGARYFLSVYGMTSDGAPDVPFTARALLVDSRMAFQKTKAVSTGTVCDGKYVHHFFDFPYVPASGGLEIEVQKTSGELDSFHVRQERCAGPTAHLVAGQVVADQNMHSAALFGHG